MHQGFMDAISFNPQSNHVIEVAFSALYQEGNRGQIDFITQRGNIHKCVQGTMLRDLCTLAISFLFL